MQNFTLLIGRLALALIFVLSGIDKLLAYDATAKILIAHDLPPGLLPLVILVELGGGLAVATGLFTRWAAIALCGFCLLTALLVHGNFAEHAQLINFLKNVAMAGGFLVLAASGPGTLSLDAWRRRRRQRQKLFV